MSIQEAIEAATKDVLAAYLAPDLVEKLTDEILQKAVPDIETAIQAFAGFELRAAAAPRNKNAVPARKAASAKRRKPAETDMDSVPSIMHHDDGISASLS